MNCAMFREALQNGALSPAGLAHMRSCAVCLDAAVKADPDNLFRSLGAEVDPPGGVDLFVEEVLQQVHLRKTEEALRTRTRFPAIHRWSVAAMLMIAVIGAAVLRDQSGTTPTVQTRQVVASPLVPASLPAVEAYEEANAMIIELPAEETGDFKVVMIFDETLPVDL